MSQFRFHFIWEVANAPHRCKPTSPTLVDSSEQPGRIKPVLIQVKTLSLKPRNSVVNRSTGRQHEHFKIRQSEHKGTMRLLQTSWFSRVTHKENEVNGTGSYNTALRSTYINGLLVCERGENKTVSDKMIGDLNLEVSRRGKSASRKSRNMNIFPGCKAELVNTSAEDFKGFTFCMAPLNIPELCNTNTEQPKLN